MTHNHEGDDHTGHDHSGMQGDPPDGTPSNAVPPDHHSHGVRQEQGSGAGVAQLHPLCQRT